MKIIRSSLFTIASIASLIVAGAANAQAPSTTSTSFYSPTNSALKIGVINTKKCLEESKMSKHERTTLEKLKTQMDTVLKEKQKAIYEIENKLRDEDYMEGVSEEVERELKHKRKLLIEEGMELNREFSENLEMSNMKVLQNIVELIHRASKEVVTEMNQKGETSLDLVLTSEACTYFSPGLDITAKVLVKMDELFDVAQKEQAIKKS